MVHITTGLYKYSAGRVQVAVKESEVTRDVQAGAGTLQDLDRENKAVLLPDGTIAPYDLLVLCIGRQDATAQRLGLWTRGQDPACPLRARGYLSLDIANLDGHITELLSEIRSRGGGGVLVYGNSLKALKLPGSSGGGGGSGSSGAAAAAAEADAAAKRTSYPPAAAPAIVAAINEELARAGVKTVAGFELASVDDKARVCGAVLEKRGATKWEAKTADNRAETLHRDCRLVLAGDAENVDPDIFQAVLQSGLVYDGRLVVDLSCRTVDPSIYAAGTLTKFSRAFKRASHTHDQAPPLERPPKFNCPRGVYARLPGGYHYLHANAPPPLSPPLAADGKASTGGVKRLFTLVGLYQASMKDFAGRVAAGQVQDLAAFFHQDAFAVLSHDRFKQLAADLRAALERDGGGHDLVAALNRAMDEGRDDEWVGAAITDAVAAGVLPPLTRKLQRLHFGDMSAPVTVTVRGAPAAWSAAQLAMLLAPALAAPGMPIAPVRLRAGGGGTSAAFLLLASALKTCGVGFSGAASSAAPASAASPGAAGVWELTVVRGVARRLAHSVLCAVDGTEVALRLLGPDNLTACPSCLRRHFTRPGQQCRATRCAHTTLPAACTTPAAATGTAAGDPAVATAAAAAAAAAATQRAPTGAAASHPPAPVATGAAATDAAAASTPALASASPGASPPPPAADADPAQLGQEQRIQQLQGAILEGRTARKGLQQQVKALTKLLAASEAGKRAAEADRDRSLAEQVRAERLAAQQRSLREGEQVRNAAATARLEAQLTAEAARAASVAVPAADAAGTVATTPVAGALEASSAAAGAAAAVAEQRE
ncbi:hypothetical protein JKP88DRAFT_288209 [Tribonema minus]|uniref:Uncharacterized protein n=1 Tax=Tribonema minus TaxID=303371 RepID=A0A835Z949_9STRA|nr:hypothetical protein JKP88DRAFT_288209 [Tribonema minus]